MAKDTIKDTVGGVAGIDGYLFRLIATFEAAAMQQLGKIAHPLTGEVDVDLPGAGDSIEMLTAIQRKTEGNLSDDEKRLLDHVLYQLRMNYVEVASDRKTDESHAGSSDEPADKSADEPADESAGEPADKSADDATDDSADEPAGGVTREKVE